MLLCRKLKFTACVLAKFMYEAGFDMKLTID